MKSSDSYRIIRVLDRTKRRKMAKQTIGITVKLFGGIDLDSGFNVYCGKAIWPHNEKGLESLARYIIDVDYPIETCL